MVKNSLLFFGLIFLLCTARVWGQENRYVIYFTDKNNSTYSTTSPEAFLSQKAIERRQKNQIAVVESDLPVNETYIQQVEALGVNVFYASKWLNAALIEAVPAKVTEIEGLSVVQKVEFVAPGGKLGSRIAASTKMEKSHFSKRANRTNNTDLTNGQNSLLGIPHMHQLGYRGENILIGVFDSGFQEVDNLSYFGHLFTDNRIKYTFDYVNNNQNVFAVDDHGTQVLACVGAFQEDKLIGTAPGAEFALCITEDVSSEYRVEEYNWIFAAEKADSLGVDIITTSLGYNTFDDPAMDYTTAEIDGQTAIISIGAQLAADKGILLIVSAGNLGNDATWKIITPPADVDQVITVGSITADTVKTTFSSIGPTADGRTKPDVVTLGADVVVGYDETSDRALGASGTSFSAPMVAGLAAGIMQAFPDKNRNEVLQMIRDSGHQANNSDTDLGFGIPSFGRARILVVGIEDKLTTAFSLFPNPVDREFYLKLENDSRIGGVKVLIFSSLGKVVYESSRPVIPKNQQIKIDAGNLIPGLYFVQVIDGNNRINAKFLKN
ncbi:S8 family serine peptidase [Fulvivirgaceae bacterium BMA12]|uniref:S8 family serine peptidase n=1 Tax=Agaribacillus aureus TaxID=3051825 RepID=A0ABT8KYX6_9BACT|nr:S8 family serine peptidase [Fulvivirgaceae bacterium BMA12]